MYKIYLLLLCLLLACAQKTNNEQSEISSADELLTANADTLNDPEIQEVRDTIVFVKDKSKVSNLINFLRKIETPAVVGDYENDKPDSLWIRIPDADIKHLVPMDVLGDSQGEVYGIGSLSYNNTYGVLYYIKFSNIDPEEVDAVLSKTILVLYDSDNLMSDYKVVGISEYGSGFSKIYDSGKIVYLYTSEMEDRRISKEVYLIKNGKFTGSDHKSTVFKSGSQDDEKYNAYIESAF